jgi:uncharacterized protein
MLTLAAVLAGYAILVLLLQRPMMFPAPARAAAPSRSPAERILLDLPFGPVEAFLLMPAGAGPYPLLVFTHGNGELAQDWIDEFATVPAWGWAALLVEYPGYGGSAGRPSRASIRAAMLAAYDRAAADPRVDRYLATDAPRLRGHVLEVFPEGVTLGREEWDVLARWP